MGMVIVIREVKIFWVNGWKCFKKNLIIKYFVNFIVKEGFQMGLRKKALFGGYLVRNIIVVFMNYICFEILYC